MRERLTDYVADCIAERSLRYMFRRIMQSFAFRIAKRRKRFSMLQHYVERRKSDDDWAGWSHI
jgi:hypothetical protein